MSDWYIIFITLIFSAFASGCEIAFISSNKLRIELDRSQGSFAAKIIWNFVKSPSRFIAAMLIANNIALVIYGIIMAEHILTPEFLSQHLPLQLHGKGTLLIIQTFLSTMIILIAAEFLPKVIFRINPNATLKFLVIPLRLLYMFIYPIVWVIIGLSRFFMKILFQ